MKTSHTILTLLGGFDASTGVLADDLRQPAKVVEAFCRDLEIDGLVTSHSIKDAIRIWRITEAGREVVNSLPAPAAV